MKRLAFALIALALAAYEKPAPQPTPEPATATQTTGAPRAEAVEAERPAPKLLPTAEVQAVVDAWLQAQNASDFAAYEKLYAAKFEGIKRVGPKKSSFDRAGWLEDRKRMFGKKMDVAAADLEINAGGASAVVTFTQTWSSGDYEDVGPKRLVVAVQADKSLAIAREEMLSSTVVGADATATPYDATRLALLADEGFVVLRTDADRIETTTPAVLHRGFSAIADVKDPPPELASMIGRSFEIHGATDCAAKITSLHVLARAHPHFGEAQYWDGEVEGSPRMSDADVAGQTWELAAGRGTVVVGRLDQPCKGGVWAHANDAAPEAVLATVDAAALKDRAIAQFRKLAGYQVVQKDFEGYDRKGPWDDAGGLSVTAFGAGAPEVVAVVAAAGDGCGDFIGEFWALFEVRGQDLVLLSDAKDPGPYFDPGGAARVDGEVVFFSPTMIARKVGTVWRVTNDATVPSFDCPC